MAIPKWESLFFMSMTSNFLIACFILKLHSISCFRAGDTKGIMGSWGMMISWNEHRRNEYNKSWGNHGPGNQRLLEWSDKQWMIYIQLERQDEARLRAVLSANLPHIHEDSARNLSLKQRVLFWNMGFWIAPRKSLFEKEQKDGNRYAKKK